MCGGSSCPWQRFSRRALHILNSTISLVSSHNLGSVQPSSLSLAIIGRVCDCCNLKQLYCQQKSLLSWCWDNSYQGPKMTQKPKFLAHGWLQTHCFPPSPMSVVPASYPTSLSEFICYSLTKLTQPAPLLPYSIIYSFNRYLIQYFQCISWKAWFCF